MVSWGMGHNLQKNLERAASLRARGQLDKALAQLQDWAGKHPETPHYQFEAAMVAFELRDWTTGIGCLRSLMRALPETREKVLGACREQFEETAALPLAEFLIEHALGDADIETTVALVHRLDPENRGVYLRKVSMRQRSMASAGEKPADKLLQAVTLQFLLACSVVDATRVRETIPELAAHSTFPASHWTKQIDKALSTEPQNQDLLISRAHSLAAEGKVDLASQTLVRVARLYGDELQDCLALLQSFEPTEDTRGAWLHAQGDLHILASDGAAAARAWTEAADANPKLREALLERLVRPSEDNDLPGREETLKLRLRLLVVQKHFDEIPELALRLVSDGLAQPGELRALLGEGQDIELPNEMTAVLAEIALRDGDIVAGAKFAYEIPTSDSHSCRRLLRAVDALLEDWEEETRLQLYALRAVLRARILDRNGANTALADAWRECPTEVDTLCTVSDRCLESVDPLPEFVREAMAALCDHGDPSWLRPMFLELCAAEDTAPAVDTTLSGGAKAFDSFHTGSFSQDALDLELGGSAENFSDELALAMLDILREKPARAKAFLAFFDGLDRPGLEPDFRHPVALAAAWNDDTDRALPAFSLLTMMAPRDFVEQVASDLDALLEAKGDSADLLLARADLHTDLEEIEPATELLDRALRLDPARSGDIIERFDRLLDQAEDDAAPRLQVSLAEALFEVSCFDRLGALCERAISDIEGPDQVPFLSLQIRMAIARGEFSEALQRIQQHTVQGPMPPSAACKLLEEALEANPGSPISHLMMGQLATRAGLLARAIEAYVEAVRLDPSLRTPVAEQIHELSNNDDTDAALMIAVARFHLECDAPDRAAYALDRSLHREPVAAARVLGEIEPLLESADCHLDLVSSGARAARLAARPELACELLLRVEREDPGRFETVLAEFRNLRVDFPELILPAQCMTEVLVHQNSPEAAARTAIETATESRYDLEDRIAMVRDFHRQIPDNTELALTLAGLLAEQGERGEACEIIESCLQRDGFQPEQAAAVTRRLRVFHPDHAGLALLHHDLLVRLGEIDEALTVLPDATAFDPENQSELTRRYEAHRSRVVEDPDLALACSASLLREGRPVDAMDLLATAALSPDLPADHPLLLEWARLLHENGDTEQSAEILSAHFKGDEQRRAAFQSFGQWNDARLDAELATLRDRFTEHPEDLDCALEIAGLLLEAERAAEAHEFLGPIDFGPDHKPRRALLLGRAHLQLQHAEDAEALLLDAIAAVGEQTEDFGEMQYRLAECADRLGRPDEATARLRRLLADPRYELQARARARSTYAHHLSETAGERRAVLCAVSSLERNPSRSTP